MFTLIHTINMTIYKIRKISLYNGLGLTKWLQMESKEKALEFINNNQSYSGAFQWIMKSNTH